LRYTRIGRDLLAVGSSELVAYMSGVKPNLARAIAFSVSAICAAVGGVLLVSQTLYSAPTIADSMLLPALVGVVVGGTAISGGIGGITMSLVGGLTAVFVRVGATIVGLPAAAQDVAYGIVVLVAVAITTDREKIGVIK
jgi:ribose transport system permease protein